MIRLGPKTFSVLVVLLDEHGRVVLKDDVLNRAWGEHVSVEQSNLTFQINSLRVALGDTGNPPRHIETVRGRGYKFIGDVTYAAGEAEGGRTLAAAAGGGAPPEPAWTDSNETAEPT